MPFFKSSFKFISVSIFIASLALSGCSYLPWSDDENEDEDLFFEEDFGSEFEAESQKASPAKQKEEDNFFNDEPQMAQSKPAKKPDSESFPVSPDAEDFFFEDEPQAQPAPQAAPTPAPRPAPTPQPKTLEPAVGGGGFASVDQKTDKEELKVDVAVLQSQQEELMFRVQELQKIVSNLEPRLAATQEQMDISMGAGTGSPIVNAEIESLKMEIARLNDEISALKNAPAIKKAVPSKQTKAIQKSHSVRRHLKQSGTPKEYDLALAAYKAGRYDESILLFQELGLNDPPESLKDNIVFWIGNNYLKLEMYDDAIKQFQTVLTQFPGGNKVHDSRYMLGVCYQKKATPEEL